MNSIDIRHGDCLEVLRSLPDNSVDSVVTDPPYGLSNTKPAQVADVLAAWVTGDTEAVPAKKGGFMGKDWDSFVPPPAVWAECLRVLKPGGHMAVFAGARTQDLMGLSIRLAGFEIRDTLGWIYGSGFPKSMDVSKAIDKSNGENRARQFEFTEWMRSTGVTARQIDEATGTNMGGHYLTTASQPAIATADLFDLLRPLLPEVPERIERLVAERTGIEWTDYVKREVVGEGTSGKTYAMGGLRSVETSTGSFDVTAPATSEAAQWSGWGTALKPAIEPIILARKPLDGTVAANVLAHGVGGLNIDACRVEGAKPDTTRGASVNASSMAGPLGGQGRIIDDGKGRFPANVLLDENAAKEIDEQSGVSMSVRSERGAGKRGDTAAYGAHGTPDDTTRGHTDSGGASRFFPVFKYQAKAPKKERPVIYLNECECNEWQSPEKATTESTSTGGRSWNTSTSGSGSTGQCQTDTTSITSTMTSSTIESKTYDASPELSTSASIQAANCETESGGNRAECADHSSPSVMGTGTSVKKAGRSTDGAAPVTSRKWFTTSECESCGAPRRKVTHCTVKPVALMEWLVTLITPEGGTTLDPFAGTGTTLQAARDKGFAAIGVEQDADYIALIEQRLGGAA